MSLKKVGRKGEEGHCVCLFKGGEQRAIGSTWRKVRSLKDKAEVYSEEKIITSLGLLKLSFEQRQKKILGHI